jgi:small subunit ribosomal protein S7
MRKKKVIKRHSVKPDKKFSSVTVSKLVNKVMRRGEKRIAARIVYQAAEIIEKWFKENQAKLKKEKLTAEKVTKLKKSEEKNPLEVKEVNLVDQVAEVDPAPELLKTASSPFLKVLEGALTNIKPSIEMKRVKRGSTSRRVPKTISEDRALKIALKWLVEGEKERQKKGKKLPNPIFEMFENLAEEIKSAYNKSGEAFKRKETLYKEAMGNMELTSPF